MDSVIDRTEGVPVVVRLIITMLIAIRDAIRVEMADVNKLMEIAGTIAHQTCMATSVPKSVFQSV